MTQPILYRIPVSTGKLVGLSMPPKNLDWATLRQVGITHLISLCEVSHLGDFAPVRHLYHHTFESISHDQVPRDPKTERHHLWQAAHYAWAVLRRGHGVAFLSEDGLHPTILLLTATLRLRGLPLDRALELVLQQATPSGAAKCLLASWHLQELDQPPQELLQLTQPHLS